MVYTFTRRSGVPLPPILDEEYGNSHDALCAFKELCRRVGESDLQILRNSVEISAFDLVHDERHDVQQVLDDETRLRPGYREARGAAHDLALGPEGPTAVWKPENPEDQFE